MILGDALRRSANVYPDKIAVIDKVGKYLPINTKYTYKELYEKANSLANGLLSLGLKKQDRVALLTDARIQFLTSWFAIAKAGLILAPISTAYLGRELNHLLNDSGARALIIDTDQVEKVEAIKSQIGVEYFIGLGQGHNCPYDLTTMIKENPPTEPQVKVDNEDLVALLYTSGTTGLPKGAMITHRNFSASMLSFMAEMRPAPYWKSLSFTPPFTGGGIFSMSWPIFRGSTVVLSNFEPEKALQIIEEEKIDLTVLAPTLTARVVRYFQSNPKEYDFSNLKRIMTTAAPISPELIKESSKIFGDVYVMPFGCTETVAMGTFLHKEEVALEGPLSKRLSSVGKAMVGYEAKVVDDEGNEVKPGEVGELMIKGDAVAKGYWNKPEETATEFEDGWWHTGDLARVDEDEYIHIVDRKKDMILSGGMNVYPREIEDVLYAHPAVLHAAVIPVPDEEWGESVKAVIVPRPGAKVTEEEIIGFCKQNLASYKKPRSIDFVETVPINPQGKIMKRELRDMYREKYKKDKEVIQWGETKRA